MSQRSDRLIQVVMLILAIILMGSCALVIGDMDYADAAAMPTSAPTERPESYFSFLPLIEKSGEFRPTHAPTEEPPPPHHDYCPEGSTVPECIPMPNPTPIIEQCRSVAIMEPGVLGELSAYCCEVYGLMCEVPGD